MSVEAAYWQSLVTKLLFITPLMLCFIFNSSVWPFGWIFQELYDYFRLELLGLLAEADMQPPQFFQCLIRMWNILSHDSFGNHKQLNLVQTSRIHFSLTYLPFNCDCLADSWNYNRRCIKRMKENKTQIY